MAEWWKGGQGRRFVTASAVQISSACGKRTKKDVPFGDTNNICLVGTYHRQSGVAAGNAGSLPPAPYKYHPLAVNAPKRMCLLGIQNNICLVGTYHRQRGVAAGNAGSLPPAPYKYHPLMVNAPKKMCLLGIQNNICLVGTYHRQSGVAAGNAGSLPPAPYKYHPLAVNAPKRMCLLGYKIIFAWWAHISLRAEWRPGTQVRYRQRRTNIICLQ
jgi:hypothetical protein